MLIALTKMDESTNVYCFPKCLLHLKLGITSGFVKVLIYCECITINNAKTKLFNKHECT
jgi:hypothetical protein